MPPTIFQDFFLEDISHFQWGYCTGFQSHGGFIGARRIFQVGHLPTSWHSTKQSIPARGGGGVRSSRGGGGVRSSRGERGGSGLFPCTDHLSRFLNSDNEPNMWVDLCYQGGGVGQVILQKTFDTYGIHTSNSFDTGKSGSIIFMYWWNNTA